MNRAALANQGPDQRRPKQQAQTGDQQGKTNEVGQEARRHQKQAGDDEAGAGQQIAHRQAALLGLLSDPRQHGHALRADQHGADQRGQQNGAKRGPKADPVAHFDEQGDFGDRNAEQYQEYYQTGHLALCCRGPYLTL